MPKVLVRDPATSSRDGWHEMYGDSADALNGNVSRIFLTGVLQSVATTDCRQPDGWSCGPYAMAECLGMADGEEARAWLQQRGMISYEWGTTYEGVVGYINVKGYDCAYDGIKHDGERAGAALEGIIRHLRQGNKVILCMHGTSKGCRTDYWTKSGHYICLYGIEDNHIKVDGKWGPTTTARAQEVLGTFVDGKVSNQPAGMFGWLFPFCEEQSWIWVPEDQCGKGSELIMAIQQMIGAERDGKFGPDSLKRFQKWLGVPVTKTMNAKTVKAWQRWLNKQI